MKKKEWSDLGDDLRKIVKNTVDSGDYKKLGKDVSDTVNSALEMAFEEARKAIASIQVESQQPKPQAKRKKEIVRVKPKPIYFPHAPVGNVAGILLTVFGIIGTFLTGALVLILGLLGAGPVPLGGALLLLVSSIVMDIRGSGIRNRIKRYRRYLNYFMGKDSCSVGELSAYSGFNEKFVVKDMRKMIDIGMFPQGHINNEETLIMLNRDRYQRYLKEQKELEAVKQEQLEDQRKLESMGRIGLELAGTIEDGKDYIRQVSEANAKIHDKEVSAKVLRMEEIIGKIIGYIEEHPSQLSDVRKFMRYYLPTTLKLLHAYQEFEQQPIQGENITTAKTEIKDALDTINAGFVNLFDGFFASASMDVSTDISVLETMFAQEGLTEDDFDVSNNEGGNEQ